MSDLIENCAKAIWFERHKLKRDTKYGDDLWSSFTAEERSYHVPEAKAVIAILSKPENITEGAARELLRYDPILDRNPQPNQIQSARKAIAAALSSLLKE